MRDQTYVGIDKDEEGAMNPTGNIVRDAWVFGLIPETQTCEGWTAQQISGLYAQVSDAWEPYGHLPSQLPDELREKHQRIYAEAIEQAKKKGWDPDGALTSDV